VSPGTAERLRSFDIQTVADVKDYSLLVRGECVALVYRNAEGSVSIGASGLMTANGVAYLVWQDGQALLAAKGHPPAAAEPGQVETVRKFSADLKQALGAEG
jgi:hypothetical protein